MARIACHHVVSLQFKSTLLTKTSSICFPETSVSLSFRRRFSSSNSKISMSLKAGIVGLPDVGNSTLFNAVDDFKEDKVMYEGDYKMPLVWIDLEMTGLNIEVDRILEIACIITDGKLTKTVEGPDLIIHQTKECLDKMGKWCQDHHAASGLTEKVIQSSISEKEAERQVVDFIKKHVGTYTPLIAGNSIYVDFMFLKKYMPDLASVFRHVVVDVGSVKALCNRWFPNEKKKAPRKDNKHRAMDDIKESIAELKYYKENVFRPSKSKK